MFPIKDSVPSRSTPVATRALILVNVVVFFLSWDCRTNQLSSFSLCSNGTSAGDVSDLLFPILLRNSGCVLSSSLVFHAIIQRHDGSGWSPTGRWYRLVGTHRGICRRNALVLVVCGKTEPPNAT